MTTIAAGPEARTIALIGNPNTGKSTLFGALSGVQQRVGNYPGVTVEKKTGKLKEAKADQAHTTAPEPVVLCVLESLAGLTLQPPDGNDGKATFAYDLHPAS